MSSKNSKKNDSSFVSYQHERFETEMCNNIEIFEDRSKAILYDLEEILSIEKETLKLNDFRNNLTNHFSHFKNEHFSLIEQIKKFNFENEILIEEYHNQNLKITELESINDDLRIEIKRLKNLEISNIHLEETLKNKTKDAEKNEELVSQLNQKINLMKIEIEELNLHNEDLKNQLILMTHKFEKMKFNILEKDKDFNNFRKSIHYKNYDISLRNSLTERNRNSLFKLEEKILGLPSKETNYQSIFNNSIVIESKFLNEQEEKSSKTNAENALSLKDLEEMNSNNNNNKENLKNNSIPVANFVSSTGIEDMTQYNTAVSVTSNNLKKKDDKGKNTNNLMINYLKNNLPKNKLIKKPKENFLKIKREQIINQNQKITKETYNPETNQLKNLLSLENVLTTFDSEEKVENYNDIKRPKKIEINFNDKNFHENYQDNAKQQNKINAIRKKSNSIRQFDFNNASSCNLRKILSEGEIINKKDCYYSEVRLVNDPSKQIIKLVIVNSIKLELLRFESNKSFNNSISQTEKNKFIQEKNSNNLREDCSNDPLKEFFLLTFQAVKVNYSEYIEILNLINPEILYQEVKLMNTPFHMFNNYIFTKFQIEDSI